MQNIWVRPPTFYYEEQKLTMLPTQITAWMLSDNQLCVMATSQQYTGDGLSLELFHCRGWKSLIRVSLFLDEVAKDSVADVLSRSKF